MKLGMCLYSIRWTGVFTSSIFIGLLFKSYATSGLGAVRENLSLAYPRSQVTLVDEISASIEKVYHHRIEGAEFKEDRYVLYTEIGKLTHEEFDTLIRRYENSSHVPFHPGRVYQLKDFLPPFAQATLNKLFPPAIYWYRGTGLLDIFDESEVWPIVKNGIEVSSNCWNASFEYLMSLYGLSQDELKLYIPDMFSVVDFLEQKAERIQESDVLPGDVVVVSNGGNSDSIFPTIQHTAVILAPNLVFEKVSPDELAPFRISFLSDMKNKFARFTDDSDNIESQMEFNYYRINKKNIKRLNLETMGQIYFEPIRTELATELVKIHPEVRPKNLLQTCAPGLGGGCDPFMSQVEEFKLVKRNLGLYQISDDENRFIDLSK